MARIGGLRHFTSPVGREPHAVPLRRGAPGANHRRSDDGEQEPHPARNGSHLAILMLRIRLVQRTHRVGWRSRQAPAEVRQHDFPGEPENDLPPRDRARQPHACRSNCPRDWRRRSWRRARVDGARRIARPSPFRPLPRALDQRCIEEKALSIDDAVLVASSLSALGGARHGQALALLRALVAA